MFCIKHRRTNTVAFGLVAWATTEECREKCPFSLTNAMHVRARVCVGPCTRASKRRLSDGNHSPGMSFGLKTLTLAGERVGIFILVFSLPRCCLTMTKRPEPAFGCLVWEKREALSSIKNVLPLAACTLVCFYRGRKGGIKPTTSTRSGAK